MLSSNKGNVFGAEVDSPVSKPCPCRPRLLARFNGMAGRTQGQHDCSWPTIKGTGSRSGARPTPSDGLYWILWGERLEYEGRVLISPGGTERRTDVRGTWQFPAI